MKGSNEVWEIQRQAKHTEGTSCYYRFRNSKFLCFLRREVGVFLVTCDVMVTLTIRSHTQHLIEVPAEVCTMCCTEGWDLAFTLPSFFSPPWAFSCLLTFLCQSYFPLSSLLPTLAAPKWLHFIKQVNFELHLGLYYGPICERPWNSQHTLLSGYLSTLILGYLGTNPIKQMLVLERQPNWAGHWEG